MIEIQSEEQPAKFEWRKSAESGWHGSGYAVEAAHASLRD
jgi:hypothetical protein